MDQSRDPGIGAHAHVTLGQLLGASLLCFAAAGAASAQTSPQTTFLGLTDPTLLGRFNALEIASAQANQATYDTLTAKCAISCSPGDSAVLNQVTLLVDTANALVGKGPTGKSLGLDITGLRLALRWTAAEEVAAIGSVNTKFSSNQLSGLASRLSALRLGAGGIGRASLMNGAPGEASEALIAASMINGAGGASGDPEALGSRFSAYFNETYDYGDKAPTDFEDAFAYDGTEYTLGADYRFSRHVVAGAVFGISRKRIDFNSDLSTVDGNIRARGYSGILYGMWEGDNAYASLSAGYQRLSYDINRRINYPTFNPAVSRGVDSTALSNTASNTFLSSVNGGYSVHWRQFSAEPYATATYKNIRIDPFQEQSHRTSDPAQLDFYGTVITPQTIRSFEVSAGMKLQCVLTTRIAVFVPFVNGAYHNQLADKARTYTASYAAAAADVGPQGAFVLRTDSSPGHYFTVAGGFSTVLPHGLQAFIEYSRLFQYTNYTDSVISGGVRYEF